MGAFLFWAAVVISLTVLTLSIVTLVVFLKDKKKRWKVIDKSLEDNENFQKYLDERFEAADQHRAMLYKLVTENQAHNDTLVSDNTEQMRMAFVNTNAVVGIVDSKLKDFQSDVNNKFKDLQSEQVQALQGLGDRVRDGVIDVLDKKLRKAVILEKTEYIQKEIEDDDLPRPFRS